MNELNAQIKGDKQLGGSSGPGPATPSQGLLDDDGSLVASSEDWGEDSMAVGSPGNMLGTGWDKEDEVSKGPTFQIPPSLKRLPHSIKTTFGKSARGSNALYIIARLDYSEFSQLIDINTNKLEILSDGNVKEGLEKIIKDHLAQDFELKENTLLTKRIDSFAIKIAGEDFDNMTTTLLSFIKLLDEDQLILKQFKEWLEDVEKTAKEVIETRRDAKKQGSSETVESVAEVADSMAAAEMVMQPTTAAFAGGANSYAAHSQFGTDGPGDTPFNNPLSQDPDEPIPDEPEPGKSPVPGLSDLDKFNGITPKSSKVDVSKVTALFDVDEDVLRQELSGHIKKLYKSKSKANNNKGYLKDIRNVLSDVKIRCSDMDGYATLPRKTKADAIKSMTNRVFGHMNTNLNGLERNTVDIWSTKTLGANAKKIMVKLMFQIFKLVIGGSAVADAIIINVIILFLKGVFRSVIFMMKRMNDKWEDRQKQIHLFKFYKERITKCFAEWTGMSGSKQLSSIGGVVGGRKVKRTGRKFKRIGGKRSVRKRTGRKRTGRKRTGRKRTGRKGKRTGRKVKRTGRKVKRTGRKNRSGPIRLQGESLVAREARSRRKVKRTGHGRRQR
jgi:hypothetical protein